MRQLFVDCDDTLIIYDNPDSSEGQHAYGYLQGYPWHPNEKLVSYIKWFAAEYPRTLIVIWSGGGGDYARTIANRILGDLEVATMIKDDTTYDLVRPNDIVFDDCDLPIVADVLRPDALDKYDKIDI